MIWVVLALDASTGENWPVCAYHTAREAMAAVGRFDKDDSTLEHYVDSIPLFDRGQW